MKAVPTIITIITINLLVITITITTINLLTITTINNNNNNKYQRVIQRRVTSDFIKQLLNYSFQYGKDSFIYEKGYLGFFLQNVLFKIHQDNDNICYFKKRININPDTQIKKFTLFRYNKDTDTIHHDKEELNIELLKEFIDQKCSEKKIVGLHVSYNGMTLKNKLVKQFAPGPFGHVMTIIIDKTTKEVLLFNLNSYLKDNFNKTSGKGGLSFARFFVPELQSMHESLHQLLTQILPEDPGWTIDLIEYNTCKLSPKKNNPLFIQGLINGRHRGCCGILYQWYTHLRFSHPELSNAQLYGAIQARIKQFKKKTRISTKLEKFILDFFIQLFIRLGLIYVTFTKQPSSNDLIFSLRLVEFDKRYSLHNTDKRLIKIPITFITQTQRNDPYHILKHILNQNLQHLNNTQNSLQIVYIPDPSLLTQPLPTLYDELDEIFPI